ncbi:gluconate 2-dehydrogenase subunit 3 family protein [Pseudonocardia kunmingensis]|uniref:Gluconate 2-dehydrogenase subunit 3-like protein n=1 Tax=Pseudonocardia kunmingensis TaxID=630975 RepID=A0A543DVH4_9PSEU|nr:gluconate 2-dehydrogenase subunit 3 family protein [Pseudonocardia kunmingensis]TQM13324.1 gluconate 2-dehydrogenase subunit 3-like protein [Pseudonocardia kunmingensis]
MTDLNLTSRDERPPLGGWLPGVRLTELQTAVLNAAADELVPGGDGFPAPSEVDVVSFIARYVAPAGVEPRWFPFFGEDDLRARLDVLDRTFADANSAERVTVLEGLEREDPEFFTRLRNVVYHAYYSRPEVIRAMNRLLPAAKDYRNSPQPYGYSDVMDDWDDELLGRVRGTYTRTEDVRRTEIPADLPHSDRAVQAQVPLETVDPLPAHSTG